MDSIKCISKKRKRKLNTKNPKNNDKQKSEDDLNLKNDHHKIKKQSSKNSSKKNLNKNNLTKKKKTGQNVEVDDDSENESDNDNDFENEDNLDSDDNNEDDETSEVENEKQTKNLNVNDAEEGKTLFIRNLSFDAVEDDLEELFEEFGPLNYCRVVVNKKSQHSQGVAFVKFRSKDDAQKCLERFQQDDNKFVLNGRKLNIVMALTKENAQKINNEKKAQEEKKGSQRNLHLIRLLLIRPGTQAAEGLSKEDLIKRMKVESVTREKLKNPNIFVSPTRLCVRNIPVNIDDKQLKIAFLKAANDKSAKITECRIMRDLTRPNSEGVCKSKGYGFVEFNSHDHARTAALATNNNPDIFPGKRRLIVEFSLENKSALEAKQKRFMNSQAKLLSSKKPAVSKIKFEYPTPPANDNPKQKPLPSHWGAKVRHKPRNNQVNKKTLKKEKLKRLRNDSKERNHEPRKKRRKKVQETCDRLDTLISVYRNKLNNKN